MSGSRIKVTLYNRTFKEIDMSDFTRITEGIFSNRDDIVEVAFPEGVEVIAPNAFEPVIEEGVRDGSLSVMFPKQAAEAVSLIANIWINPLVFPVDNEELKAKFEFICGITKSIGLDISDIYPLLDKMNSDINL